MFLMAVDRVRPRGGGISVNRNVGDATTTDPRQTLSLRPDGDVLLVFSRLSPKNRGEKNLEFLDGNK